jgi:hypothetical protein
MYRPEFYFSGKYISYSEFLEVQLKNANTKFEVIAFCEHCLERNKRFMMASLVQYPGRDAYELDTSSHIPIVIVDNWEAPPEVQLGYEEARICVAEIELLLEKLKIGHALNPESYRSNEAPFNEAEEQWTEDLERLESEMISRRIVKPGGVLVTSLQDYFSFLCQHFRSRPTAKWFSQKVLQPNSKPYSVRTIEPAMSAYWKNPKPA